MPVKVGLKLIEIWNDSMEDAVLEYEKEPIVKGQIVFYGPSTFTRWSEKWGMRPLRDDLLGASGEKCCINRGFGSSCPEHQLYYYNRLIKPLEPKVLVYKSHGNSKAFGYSNEEAWEIAQRVIAWARTDFPDIKIYLCGANTKRTMTTEDTESYNQYDTYAREFAKNTPNCHFIDLMAEKSIQGSHLYVEDGVHFNQEGYDRFRDFWLEALKDELKNY